MLVGRFHVETVAERLEMADMVGSKFFKACILLHCVFKSRYIHTCIKQKCIIKCINNCVYIYFYVFYVFNAERTSRVKIKRSNVWITSTRTWWRSRPPRSEAFWEPRRPRPMHVWWSAGQRFFETSLRQDEYEK